MPDSGNALAGCRVSEPDALLCGSQVVVERFLDLFLAELMTGPQERMVDARLRVVREIIGHKRSEGLCVEIARWVALDLGFAAGRAIGGRTTTAEEAMLDVVLKGDPLPSHLIHGLLVKSLSFKGSSELLCLPGRYDLLERVPGEWLLDRLPSEPQNTLWFLHSSLVCWLLLGVLLVDRPKRSENSFLGIVRVLCFL